jgi:pyruvate/2-oxoglutarate dehydrogenase complex dihydrolipoamide acyltransferase (E2) component
MDHAKLITFRKALEAEATAAAADTVAAAQADAIEQQKLRNKAAKAREKADTAKDLASEKASEAGLEPGVEPQAADATPQRGLAHRADGSPKASAQRNHRCAEGCAYTDPDNHIIKSDGNLLQGYNCQAAVDGDHQVIVAIATDRGPGPHTWAGSQMLLIALSFDDSYPKICTSRHTKSAGLRWMA